ncbi:PREDICTED: ran-binding protein 3, partial [Acanthisitta chloris]|uniref:ran-binding protein 3 n=1 Tax=Acanthisitta chloris TaxID=57068 RepID=UPI0004F0D0A1
KKNNIFVTSALLQRNPDFIKSTRKGFLPPSQLRNVIRPAVLQPPQALTCPENPVVSLVTEKEACVQFFLDCIASVSHKEMQRNSGITKVCQHIGHKRQRKPYRIDLEDQSEDDHCDFGRANLSLSITIYAVMMPCEDNMEPHSTLDFGQIQNDVNAHIGKAKSVGIDTLNLFTLSPVQYLGKDRSQFLEDRSVQSSKNSDFVFGENMVERVLSPEKHPKLCNEADLWEGEITSMYIGSSYVSLQTNTAVLQNATLIESAAACVSKPVKKILLDKVEVITGEEAEHNVLQINCKLFVFNKLSLTWTERGRGSLRLNDTSSNKCGTLQSRLIMRNQGSLRLILNTRLWEQMVIKRANRKSLCFTATDQEDQSVQVFLTQASSKDTEHLYAAIHHRLVALRSFAEQEPDANQVDTESEIAFQPLVCDTDDEDDEKISQVSSSGADPSRWNHRQSVVCS